MTIHDQTMGGTLQYTINREAVKIPVLSSGEINKYEYLKGDEILPSNQKPILEQTKFTYSPLGKAFQKQLRATENQGNKKVRAIVEHGKKRARSNNTLIWKCDYDTQS